MTATLERDAGSYRDPAGHVFMNGSKVFRTVTPCGAAAYEYVRDSGSLTSLIEQERVISASEVDPSQLNGIAEGASYVLEHPRLRFISYPYEWPFAALKAAALAHLDIQIELLEKNVSLVDASAYNIQFAGTHPIFIDYLSFQPYEEGALWQGHRQFCEQFLNPLLLRALVGVPHNGWYGGCPDGIPSDQLNCMVPFGRKLSRNVLKHVVLPAKLQSATLYESESELNDLQKALLPKPVFHAMLAGLRTWIAALDPRGQRKTIWSDYTTSRTYNVDETEAKGAFVRDFVVHTQPKMLWDMGCNTGEFAEIALTAGSEEVIGFDADQGALDIAFARAKAHNLRFLPLFLDAANPSSGRGWNDTEKKSLAARSCADAVLALAFIHHLAIGRNVPLPDVVDWLVDLAPRGVIEFVQKSDETVQRMLRFRSDVFPTYSEETFRAALTSRARIVREQVVSSGGRVLFWYEQ